MEIGKFVFNEYITISKIKTITENYLWILTSAGNEQAIWSPKARPHYILPLLVSRKPIWDCELSVNTSQVNLLTVQVDSQGLPIPSYRKWCNRLLCFSVITLSFPLGKSRIQISLLEHMIMWLPLGVVTARSETINILSPPKPSGYAIMWFTDATYYFLWIRGPHTWADDRVYRTSKCELAHASSHVPQFKDFFVSTVGTCFDEDLCDTCHLEL